MKRKFTTNSRVVTNLFAQYQNTFGAFCEIINNSIQADAKNIYIRIDYSPESEVSSIAISEIEVKDDGDGVPLSEFDNRILNIGTNAKKGGKGIGRFAALQLGSMVKVDSVAYEPKEKNYTKFTLTFEDKNFSDTTDVSNLPVDISEETLLEKQNTYYRVVISGFYDHSATLIAPKKRITSEFLQDNLEQALFEKYSIKIFSKEIKIYINENYLDPSRFVVGEPEKIKYNFTDRKGNTVEMFFTFFKVNLKDDKIKIFLTVNNAEIESVAAAFEYKDNSFSPDFGSYFIYISSPFFNVDLMRNLDLGDMHDEIRSIKEFIKEKVSAKLKEKNKYYEDFINKLRKDQFNPFQDNKGNGHEISETVFEKFAYLLEKEHHLLEKGSPLRELLYSLIQRAISNGDLRNLLDKINKLDDHFVERFKKLLENVELESVLEFSERISKHLDDLYFIEKITCGDISKYINERKELHQWLVKLQMMWLFGEQYYDATNLLSDKSLKNNLENLRNSIMIFKGEDENSDHELLKNNDIASITDLFLYSEKIIDADKREVLIVELKAPYVKISPKELDQVEQYAYEIGKQNYFPKNIKYRILLISGGITDRSMNKIKGTSKTKLNNPYFYWENDEGNIEISVMRWIDLIEANKRRLNYMSNALQIRDKSVKEKIEEEFGESQFQKVSARMIKIKV